MAPSVRLSGATEKRLTDLSKKTGTSKAYYIREAIEGHLDDLEDVYLAQQVLERIRRGEERTYSLEEVEKELGLGN